MVKQVKKQKAVVTYATGRKEEYFPKNAKEERELKKMFDGMSTIHSVTWSDR